MGGSEAAATTGYSPFLSFDVDDLDATIGAAMMAGARLDGAVRHQLRGKARMLRALFCSSSVVCVVRVCHSGRPRPSPAAWCRRQCCGRRMAT